MTKQLILDVETTGLDPTRCAIVQLSAIVEINGEIKKRFSIRMNPALGQEVVVNKNYNLHKQAYTQQGGFNIFKRTLEEFVDPYSPIDKCTLVAYNSVFDEEFIRNWFKLNGSNFYGSYFYATSECARKLAHFYFKIKGTLHKFRNFKLSTIAESLGIDVEKERLHDASYDTMLLYKVYRKICDQMEISGTTTGTTLQQHLFGVREKSGPSKVRV
jgi:DNA polymerase-3 subunit epsilon